MGPNDQPEEYDIDYSEEYDNPDIPSGAQDAYNESQEE